MTFHTVPNKRVVIAFLSNPSPKSQSESNHFEGVCIIGIDHHAIQTKQSSITSLQSSDDISPMKAAIDRFESITNLTYNSHFLHVRTGAPFSLKDDSCGADVYPFLFTLNPEDDTYDLNLEFIPLSRLTQLDPTGVLSRALGRCIVSPSLDATLMKLRSDNVSGAGHLANVAMEELAGLCYDSELLNIVEFDDWWRKLRLYGWHIAHNSRPSMGAAMKNCLVRTLSNILAARDTLGKKFGEIRAAEAKSIILDTVGRTRAAGRTIPAKFKECIRSFRDIWENKLTQSKPGKRRVPLTFLLHSSSSVVASCLTQLFPIPDRPPMRLFVLESRPLYEGVVFARYFKQRIDEVFSSCPIQPQCQLTPPPSPPVTQSPSLLPPVSVEVAVDAAVSVYSTATDIFLLAADRIYANGDVSNKIGALSAVLAMKHHAHGKKRRVVVIGTTDKISATDERDAGWDHSYEEVDGAQVTDSWPEEVGVGLRVRNMLFETVPGELIDCYVTEVGVIDRARIRQIANKHLEREEAVFDGL